MTETPFTDHPAPDPPEDRLLTFILGLEDDPEIAAAAETDAALRRRIDALRADVKRVADGVERAVPPPDDAYTSLDHARWAVLHDVIGASAHADARPRVAARSRARSRGAWHWLRVLAPAAAVVVLLAVGAATLQQRNPVADMAETGKAVEQRTDAAGVAREDLATPSTADTGQQYANVIVVRPRNARDGLQRFDVVRVLRGAAPPSLRLRTVTKPAAAGHLHVLFYNDPPKPGSGSPMASPSPDNFASTLRLAVVSRDVAGTSPPALGSASPPASGAQASGAEGEDTGYEELVFSDDDVIRFADGAVVVAVRLPDGVSADEIALP